MRGCLVKVKVMFIIRVVVTRSLRPAVGATGGCPGQTWLPVTKNEERLPSNCGSLRRLMTLTSCHGGEGFGASVEADALAWASVNHVGTFITLPRSGEYGSVYEVQ
jgi:hypothetical protein